MITMMNQETYTCSVCNTEINTPESKMMIDRDEDMRTKGTLCVDCYASICRDDPVILLKAAEYILMGGCQEMFEDDGEVPRRRKMPRGLTEQDRDLLEKLTGKREFTTLRDDEFSIRKPEGKPKAAPKKKPPTKKKRKAKKTVKKRSSAPNPERQEDFVSESVGN
jgi:hypothetical protein